MTTTESVKTLRAPEGMLRTRGRSLRQFILSAQPEAHVITVSALLLLIANWTVSQYVAERSAWRIATAVVDSVALSTIASYVYYLFVIHLDEHREFKQVAPYIRTHLQRIVADCRRQIHDISKAGGVPFNFDDYAKESLDQAFGKIAPNSDAPLFLGGPNRTANWIEYFTYGAERTRQSVRKLVDQLKYLDAEAVSLVTSIDDCMHFQTMDAVRGHKLRNTDLAVWASSYHEYCQLCHRVDQYIKSHPLFNFL